MRRAWISALAGFIGLAGCGTLLDIRPDPDLVPATNDGGSAGDAQADDAEASSVIPIDGALVGMPCPSAGPCVLAKDLQDLGSIAVAGGNVYFTRHQTAGAILQVPTSGGAVTAFLSFSNLPESLYATPAALYWVDEGGYNVSRYTFGMTTEVATSGGASPAAQLVGIGSETFWTIPGVGASTGSVHRSTAPALDPGVEISSGVDLPTALAVDSNYVYFANKTGTGKIVRLDHTGMPVTSTAVVFNDVSAIALSNAGIAAATAADGVYRAVTVGDTGFVSPWVRVSSTPAAVAIVADDATGTLYVLSANGTLEVILNALTPSSKVLNVAGCSVGRALAQDSTQVYLACQDSIVRLPK